jgi:hypothetical protein
MDETRDAERPLSTADIARAGERRADRAEGRATAVMEPPAEESGSAPLFSPEETGRMREHWTAIQAGFVDEPRESVRQADGLVADAIRQLAEIFARERSGLESQWDRGDDISTEDLRQALRRYRSFFDRLLAV